ncbi:MAG: hypothetical protein KC501_30915 [Myxococcales bacterium]|nr:hypothetical protein [Myxococcales bacterium]
MSTFTILTLAMLTLVVVSGAMALVREGLLDRQWNSRRLGVQRPLRHH